MIESQLPELADGGYWYVAPMITRTDESGEQVRVPDIPEGTAWSQWRNNGERTVVRTLEPISVPVHEETVSDILNWPVKPHARLGGK